MNSSDHNPDPAIALQRLVCQLAARVSEAAKRLRASCMLMLPDGCYKSGRKHDLHAGCDGRVFVTAWLANGAPVSEVLIEDCTRPPEPRPGQVAEEARYPRGVLMALAEALPTALEALKQKAQARDTETQAAVDRAKKLLESK